MRRAWMDISTWSLSICSRLPARGRHQLLLPAPTPAWVVQTRRWPDLTKNPQRFCLKGHMVTQSLTALSVHSFHAVMQGVWRWSTERPGPAATAAAAPARAVKCVWHFLRLENRVVEGNRRDGRSTGGENYPADTRSDRLQTMLSFVLLHSWDADVWP